MRSLRLAVPIALVAVSALVACSKTAAPRDSGAAAAPPKVGAGASAPSCVPAPVLGATPFTLDRVPGSSDVWGISRNFQGAQTFHKYAGAAWVATPLETADLGDLEAMGADGAWAVGTTGATDKSVILRYNGSTWSRSPSPSRGPINNLLYGVSFASRSAGWAVGEAPKDESSPNQAFVLQWNGRNWRQVALAVGTGASRLDAVKAISAKDVWAVGMVENSGVYEPLIMHFDGARWTRFPVPIRDLRLAEFRAVDASGSRDVWAVGYAWTNKAALPMVYHYNGTAWTAESIPTYGVSGERGPFIPPYGTQIYDVSVPSPGIAWLGGGYVEEGTGADAGSLVGHPLVLRGKADAWSQIEIPNIEVRLPSNEGDGEDASPRILPRYGEAASIAATSDKDALIAGSQQADDKDAPPYSFKVTCAT